MVLKSTSAFLAIGTLLIGAAASPLTLTPDDVYADTWFVWSDSSRCENANDLQVVIRDYSDSDENGIIKTRPDIHGELQPSGEILFKLKSPFYGSYVLSNKAGQTYAPPEVEINLFAKGAKPAGRVTFKPGSFPAEFDRLQWNPDPNIQNQKVIRPSLEYWPQNGGKTQGNEDSIDTDTYADTLWMLWCSGEEDRSLRTNLDVSLGSTLGEKMPRIEDNKAGKGDA